LNSLSILFVLTVAATLAAQQPGILVDESVQRAWADFQARHPGVWQSDWSPATGTPRAIWGPGIDLRSGRIESLDDARRHAAALLDREAELLGRGGSTFHEEIGQKVMRVYVLVYEQRYRGLPVIDGRADVRVHETGGVSLFGSTALPIPADFVTTPRLTPEDAVFVAYANQGVQPDGGLLAPANPMRLVVWGDVDAAFRTPVHLAYEVRVLAESSGKVGRAYVDALRGTFLEYRTDLHDCGFEHGACDHAHDHGAATAETPFTVSYGASTAATNVTGNVMAWVNAGLDPNGPLSNVPLRNLRVTIQGGSFAFTDAAGNFDIPHPGTTPVTLLVNFNGARRSASLTPSQGTALSLSIPATPGTPVNVQIYTAAAVQFDRSQSTAYWLTDEINEYCRAIIGSLPASADTTTITVNRTATCNAFYTANSINFYASGGGCPNTAYKTVVEHEWGHALDDDYGGISQTEGLSEGWGDVLATFYTRQPVVGTNFQGPGTQIRNATNTRTRGSCTEVHCAGESWMGWCWDVRLNLQIALGTAAGIARAEKIVIGSIVADATDQNGAAREVFVLDDDDANLNNGTPNCNPLARACTKRNIANPTPCTGSTVPGTYDLFGVGCRGTGSTPSTCYTTNEGNPILVATTRANLIYALRFTAPANLQVNGYQINTSSAGAQTLNAYLYDEAVGGTPNVQIATGTIPVGTATGWYAASFASPVNIVAGRNYFVAFQNTATPIAASTVNGGTITPYYRNDGTPWSVQQTGFAWQFRVNCVATGGAVPTMTNSGVPEIGGSFSLNLALARAGAPATLLIGLSKTAWAGGSLPFSMAGLGAPSCSLLVSPDITLGYTASGAGSVTATLNVPIDNNLVGGTFHDQFIVIDAGANALGVAVTGGGSGKIGKP
jgi:hypothetical protein